MVKKNMKTRKRKKNSPKLPDNVPELKEEVQKLTQEAEELRKQVFQLQLERDILEKAAEIIKKGVGISLEKLSNSEKAELIDALRKKYRLNTLLSSLHLSKSSYCYQVNVMKRPDKYQIESFFSKMTKQLLRGIRVQFHYCLHSVVNLLAN